jgi:predicted Zn-dependent protease
LAALAQLAPAERARNAQHYTLLELRLRAQSLDGRNPDALRRHLDALGRATAQFDPTPSLLELWANALAKATNADLAAAQLRPHLGRIPATARKPLAAALTSVALAGNAPATAARLMAEIHPQCQTDLAGVAELVRLWRMAARPDNAVGALDRLAAERGQPLALLSTNLARLHIDLLLELGRQQDAFDAARQLMAADPAAPDAFFDLFLLTARQAERGPEILAALEERAHARPRDASRWRALAEAATASGDYPRARDAWNRVIQIDPAPGDPYVRLAQLHEWTGAPGLAFDLYGQALQRRQTNAIERLLALAPGLYRDNDLPQLLAPAEQWVMESGLGRSLVRMEIANGHHDAARERYRRLLEREPQNLALRTEFAQFLIDLSEFEPALDQIRIALSQAPDDHRLLLASADALVWLGRFQEAYPVYRSLADHAPLGEALDKFVVLAQSLGRLAEAAASLEAGLAARDQVGARDYAHIAELKFTVGDLAGMRRTLETGLDRFPTNGLLRLQMAYALSDLGDQLRAARQLEHHPDLRTKPEVLAFYLSLLVQAQDFRRAGDFLARAVAPEVLADRRIMELHADVLEASNRPAQAASLYALLHNQFPNHIQYTVNLARLWSGVGRVRDAEALLEPLLDQPSAEILHLAAQVYAAGRQHKKAEQYQRRYLALLPVKPAQAWGFLGDILLARGDKTNARRAYRRGADQLEHALQAAQ